VLVSLAAPVEAAYGSGYQSYPARQVAWRPSAQPPRVSQYRWRPVEREVRRASSDSWRPRAGEPAGSTQRWARNARPVTRARDFVAQFRPDQRYDDPPQTPGRVVLPSQNSGLHSQFRPLEERSRLTYEQMYGDQRSAPQPQMQMQMQPQVPMATMPYPVTPYLPAPMPYWPRW
jgi:hypothetical protein